MKKVIIVLALVVGVNVFATNPFVNPYHSVRFIESSFKVEEEAASFPGGELALNNWFNQHMKYPKMAKEQGITGKVVLSFTIDINGKVSNIEIIETPGGGLEDEAVRLLNAMPEWKPKKQAGQLMTTKKIFSFNFQL